ncbi:MAG: sigma 54-interacting transcriptional regulator [Peptococcaceae bacterium]|nr:sigma 54-interacting transcriptional regulator [Peptococcaceae bacterium]MDH7524602.1 sigma 54-interacting transcriptional regulator [Peptococcaceae bacterium]
MAELREYNEMSQKIAEAIEAVLKLDVTIMDQEMRRIAGTKFYSSRLHEKIEKNTIFDYCFKNGKPYVIEQPRANEICFACPRLATCAEKAEICVPIKYKSAVIGVIAIVASTEEQRTKVVANKETYLEFLQKMASFLEAKYAEIQITKENTLLNQRLSNIVNTLDEGLVVFKKNGEVLYHNEAMKDLAREAGAADGGIFLKDLWQCLNSKKMLKPETEIGPNEIILEYNNERIVLLANVILSGDEYLPEIIVTLQNLRKIQKRVIQSAEKNQVKVQFSDIIGISPKLAEVKQIAAKAAASDSDVLICGESGTGKELFARAIHNQSSRRDYPFVPINCGAIPDELLESELFGYEKGAFTGAYTTKYGKFEVADNGTVFLDEISEMPFGLQVKLLRVLQEREVCRVGSNSIRKVNLRIIAATNTDLLERISKGLFREDLYYRLNIIPLNIPPLRERKEDILYIAEHLLGNFNKKLNKNITGISREAMKIFLEYPWPGNVRELQNVLEYAVNFETGTIISRECVENRIYCSLERDEVSPPSARERGITLEAYLEKAEKKFWQNIMAHYRHDRRGIERICRDLKISRATFYRKIKRLKISLKDENVSEMRQYK